MAFQPDAIRNWLPDGELPCHVAYSGGLDSHVLLHAMVRLRDAGKLAGPLRAIHVNHGLSPDADRWVAHSLRICAELDVPLKVLKVTVTNDGQGIEQAARAARYRAIAEILGPGEVLLTAHHLDDQVETLLFRMLRGTGLRGMAGIRRERGFGKNSVRRPLLDFTREELLAYARQEKLDWIEDDSNSDAGIDRNYLRHRILPELAERWPGYRNSLRRLAGLAEEGQALAEEAGGEDLQQVRSRPYKLSIAALLNFSPVRQRNILRTWFITLERELAIPAPDAYVVDRVLSEVIPAAADAEPAVNWRKGGQVMEIRRFDDYLYLVLPVAVPEPGIHLTWTGESPLELPAGLGTLSLVETATAGFALPDAGKLQVRFRQGGEKAKPAGRRTRPLKKILQDYRVPPWLRDRLPLVYHQDDLLAVADLFVCEQWQVSGSTAEGRKIYGIQWQKPDLHCGY